MLAKLAAGLPAVESSVRLEDYLTHWLEEVVRPQVRTRTYEAYKTCVDRHLTPTLGRKRLRSLTPLDIRTMTNRKLAGGLSALTVKYAHAVLRAALTQALRDGLVQRNVAALVKPPRAARKEAPHLTPDEARALLDTAKFDRLSALWVVAVTLGLRRGELLGLRWLSVDLDGGTLRVRQTVQRTKGGLVLDEPKTARSARTLPLPKMTAEALRDHGERQDKERVEVGHRWREHGLVFPSPIGTPMDPRNLNREFADLLKRAGLRKVRLHDLRHTCATFLLAQGVPLRVVMEILGHSGIAITSDTYTHVLPTLLADAIGTMDDLLGGEQEDQDDDRQEGDH